MLSARRLSLLSHYSLSQRRRARGQVLLLRTLLQRQEEAEPREQTPPAQPPLRDRDRVRSPLDPQPETRVAQLNGDDVRDGELVKSDVKAPKKILSLGIVLGIATTIVASSEAAFAYNQALTEKYQRILTKEICQDSTWLRCYRVDPGTCSTVFTPNVEQCVQTHLRDRKSSVRDKSDIEELSNTIASCIHTSFTEKYKDSKLNNEDCKDIH